MWVLLDYVQTEIEAEIIADLLREENINTKKSYPGIGNLKPTLGIINGVEMYVHEEDFSKAKTILEAFTTSESQEDE